MNSGTKFLVMILFIGVVCADVEARKLDKVSKELMDQKSIALPGFPPLPAVPLPLPPVPLPLPPPAELAEAVSATKGGLENGVSTMSKELMDQKTLPIPAITAPPLPSLPPMPLPLPPTESDEEVSATKGGGLENVVSIMSKDTKLGISIPKTAATNGVGNGFGTGTASTNVAGSTGNRSP